MNTNSQKDIAIEVLTGEVKVAQAPAYLQCLALGSCVAVILYDEERKIGGIAHVMLPSSIHGDTKDEDLLKHANHAIYELVKQMRELGAGKGALTARIVGGALVVPNTSDIGKENIDAVRNILQELNISIIDEHLGGNAGRSTLFDVATGDLQINGKVVLIETTKLSPTGKKAPEEKVAEQTKEQKVRDRTQDLEAANIATLNVLEDLIIEKSKLAEAKAKDEAILASIGDGLVVTDREMRVMFINRAGEEAIGWSNKELLGKIWQEVIQLKTEDGTRVPINKSPLFLAVHEGKKITTTTFLYTRKDTSTFPAAITVSSIRLKRKVISGILVFRDITSEKEIDRAKSEFVSLASHQLRTPLGIIKWYLEVLENEDYFKKAPLVIRKYFDEIYKSNERELSLMRNLLSVSRIEQGRVKNVSQSVNLIQQVTEIVGQMQIMARKKKVALHLTIQDHKIPSINIDIIRFHEVIEILITNAVEYTPAAGSVDVSVNKVGDTVIISVKDTGIGISQADQKKLFTKFFRSEKAVKYNPNGSGLGLYVVKSYVEGWRGKVSVESVEGKPARNATHSVAGGGSTFIISLPISQKNNL